MHIEKYRIYKPIVCDTDEFYNLCESTILVVIPRLRVNAPAMWTVLHIWLQW
jgi:hypothetical protein